jgi:hypothetical protein
MIQKFTLSCFNDEHVIEHVTLKLNNSYVIVC